MEGMNIIFLIIIFVAASAVTWFAGIALTKTTDSLDTRFKLGDALGGLILLGIAGSLPELAIVSSAAIRGDIPVIIGNLLGGIAFQTLVIVIFDFAIKGKKPLSYLAGSVELLFEALFAIVLTLLAVAGAFVPAAKSFLHLNPFSIIIVIAWVAGLFIINKARENPRLAVSVEDAAPGRSRRERRKTENHPFYAKKSTLHVVLIFAAASIATLAAGVLLEESGVAIANHFGIGTGIFAATALALVTSLPEISTGLESIFIGDNHLAISDILGGNAFMLVIFLIADILAKKPVLSYADHQTIFLGDLGVALMAIYGVAFIFKLKKRHLRLGWDSVLEILVYAAGIFLLFKI